MKVAVDVDVLVSDPKTGVYNYNQRLLRALLAIDKTNSYQLTYFGGAKTMANLGLADSKAEVKGTRWLPRKLYNLSLRTPFGLPYDLATGTDADMYLFMKFVRWPLWRKRRSLMFIYDTAFVDYPDVIETRHYYWYLNWAVPRTLNLADRVVTISENTKQRLVEHYGIAPDRIDIVTPAIDHDMFKPAAPAEIARVKAQYGISKPYILSVGTIEPRKNLVGLLRAFAAGSDELRNSYALVLAGGKGWGNTEIEQLYKELKQTMTIIRTGFVSEADLPALYSGADVFVFPSLYEGFGMPPLEAMACGTPVITADNSALPEVVGDAGILVDPHDPAALAAGIERVLGDKLVAADMRKKGLARAATYHWEKSAQVLLDIISKTGAKQ